MKKLLILLALFITFALKCDAQKYSPNSWVCLGDLEEPCCFRKIRINKWCYEYGMKALFYNKKGEAVFMFDPRTRSLYDKNGKVIRYKNMVKVAGMKDWYEYDFGYCIYFYPYGERYNDHYPSEFDAGRKYHGTIQVYWEDDNDEVNKNGWQRRKMEDLLFWESPEFYGDHSAVYRVAKELYRSYSYKKGNVNGYVVGDRYYLTEDYLESDPNPDLHPILQKVKGRFFPIRPTDTIIDIKHIEKDSILKNGYMFTYKETEVYYDNGDKFKHIIDNSKSSYQDYYVATLHRMDGILEISRTESGKHNKQTFTRKDGTVFNIDEMIMMTPCGQWTGYEYLQYLLITDSLLFMRATATYPDGTSELYINGERESVITAREKKRQEEAEKEYKQREKERAEEQRLEKAAEKEKRNKFIKKWGFYPGDYKRMVDRIKPGRPWGAIKEYYTMYGYISLIYDDGSSQKYRISGGKTCYVWVSNGKITSVSWW